jgi:hypothetical protein
MDADGQGMLKLSIREKLHRFFLFEKARLDEEMGFHHRIFGEAIEVSHVDDRKVFLERGAKPPFRKASLKRHLTSLKARFGSPAGTGILTFGPLAGCFAMAGSNASPHSLGLSSRSFRRAQLI